MYLSITFSGMIYSFFKFRCVFVFDGHCNFPFLSVVLLTFCFAVRLFWYTSIAEYIRNQSEKDYAAEQISIKQFTDPCTGEKRK